MKKLTVLLVLFAGLAFSQATQRKVTLTWEDTKNPSGTTYTLYRSEGVCGQASPSWTMLASNLSVKTYDDTTASIGRYCYEAAAVYNGIESDRSLPAEALVKPDKPTNLKVIVITETTFTSKD